jgi:hypothetical protein
MMSMGDEHGREGRVVAVPGVPSVTRAAAVRLVPRDDADVLLRLVKVAEEAHVVHGLSSSA